MARPKDATWRVEDLQALITRPDAIHASHITHMVDEGAWFVETCINCGCDGILELHAQCPGKPIQCGLCKRKCWPGTHVCPVADGIRA